MMSVFAQQPRPIETRAVPAPPLTPEKTTAEAPDNRTSAAEERVVTKLGKTLNLKGDLWVGEDVLLLGTVEGTFECSEALTVGAGSSVVGDVRARTITIKGTVTGDIRGTESVVVFPGGVVNGDLLAPRVTIIEGAQINGSVKTGGTTTEAPKDVTPAGDHNGVVLNNAAVEKLLGLLGSSR
jgi:cytoskeletal protein CcmA (bactofilin family)